MCGWGCVEEPNVSTKCKSNDWNLAYNDIDRNCFCNGKKMWEWEKVCEGKWVRMIKSKARQLMWTVWLDWFLRIKATISLTKVAVVKSVTCFAHV